MDTYDEAIDTQDNSGSGAESATEVINSDNGDTNAAIQDRMATDDNPWYSPSEGKVVTPEGEVVVDEKGNHFASMDAFEKWNAAKTAASTAKPKTEPGAQTKQPEPLSTSFDSHISGGKELTPELLQEMSKAGSDYKYADDLIPKLDPTLATQQEQQVVDPVERVKAERKNIEAVAIQPILDIRQLLIDQQADPATVDKLLAPIIQKQRAMVDTHYQASYEKALEERMDGKYGSKLSAVDAEKLQNASDANIEAMSRKYYPKGGKDAFYALINGNYGEPGADGKKPFVRGPAAQVIDLLASVALDGKKFKTEQERTSAYANTFRKITADPAKAKALFDIAHNYWLGKNTPNALKMVYNKGKQSAANDQQRVQKTIKTPPASFAPPATDSDDGMPKKGSMLRTVFDAARGGR